MPEVPTRGRDILFARVVERCAARALGAARSTALDDASKKNAAAERRRDGSLSAPDV